MEEGKSIERPALVTELAKLIDHDEPPGMMACRLASKLYEKLDGCANYMPTGDPFKLIEFLDNWRKEESEQPDRSGTGGEMSTNRRLFNVGDRVYHKRADLFGLIEKAEENGSVQVRYAPPWDQGAPAETVSVEELVFDFEIAHLT